MQKSFFLSVIIIFTCVFYFGITNAQVTPPLPTIGNGIDFKPVVSQKAQSTYFGGKITKLKASELENYESEGYECEVPGTTIEIRPIKGNTASYIIPKGLRPRTKYNVNSGQSILGKSSGSTNINCKKCETDDGEEKNCVQASFSLPNIADPWGTSRYGNSI
jgi:hypothetical protein